MSSLEKDPVGRAPKPRRDTGRAPKEHAVGKPPNPRKPALVRDVDGGDLKDMFAIFPDIPRPPRPGRQRKVPHRTIRKTLLTLVVATIAAAVPAYAHHSFSAYYFESQSVSIEGTVREFLFKSPHAMLVVNAPDPERRMQNYQAEWANPNRLTGQGVTRETLQPGDVVVVTGSPGRVESEYKMHLKEIRRPADGWSWGGGRGRRR